MQVVRFDYSLKESDFKKVANYIALTKTTPFNMEHKLKQVINGDVYEIETELREFPGGKIILFIHCYLNRTRLETDGFILSDVEDLSKIFLIEADENLMFSVNFNVDEIKTRAQAERKYDIVKYQLKKDKNYFKNMLYNTTINNNIEGMIFLLAGISTILDERNTKAGQKELALLLLKKFESFGLDEAYIMGLEVDMIDVGTSENYYNKALTFLYIKCLRLTTKRRKFDVDYDFTHDRFATYFQNDYLFIKYLSNLKRIS